MKEEEISALKKSAETGRAHFTCIRVVNLCDDNLLLMDMVHDLREDSTAYDLGRKDGVRSVLGSRGEGLTITPVKVAEDARCAGKYSMANFEEWVCICWQVIEAIAEGRCPQPRECCALLAEARGL